jgi:hypothetical protein
MVVYATICELVGSLAEFVDAFALVHILLLTILFIVGVRSIIVLTIERSTGTYLILGGDMIDLTIIKEEYDLRQNVDRAKAASARASEKYESEVASEYRRQHGNKNKKKPVASSCCLCYCLPCLILKAIYAIHEICTRKEPTEKEKSLKVAFKEAIKFEECQQRRLREHKSVCRKICKSLPCKSGNNNEGDTAEQITSCEKVILFPFFVTITSVMILISIYLLIFHAMLGEKKSKLDSDEDGDGEGQSRFCIVDKLREFRDNRLRFAILCIVYLIILICTNSPYRKAVNGFGMKELAHTLKRYVSCKLLPRSWAEKEKRFLRQIYEEKKRLGEENARKDREAREQKNKEARDRKIQEAAAAKKAAEKIALEQKDERGKAWTEMFDSATRNTYFYNTETGETSWSDPRHTTNSSSQPWTKRKDPASGKTYYHNSATNETSWTHPQALAASPDEELSPSELRSWGTGRKKSAKRTKSRKLVTGREQHF